MSFYHTTFPAKTFQLMPWITFPLATTSNLLSSSICNQALGFMDFLLKPGIKRQEDSMKETFSQKSKLTEHPNFETLLILQQKFIKGNNSSIF